MKHRAPVNKAKSASKFRRDGTKTKAPNMAGPPMRGGFRL